MGIQPMIDEAALATRIKELALQINQDYAGKSLDIVCILKGSVFFTIDLVRHLDMPVYLDFMRVSSYSGTESTGKVRLDFDVTQPIEGKDVLLIEDIVDTGRSMTYLLKSLSVRKPASLKICTLLYKPSRLQFDVTPDYIGFEIEDKFVVGYGLDLNGQYRNLPYVGIYNQEQEDDHVTT